MVPPSARFPTRRAALAEEAARRALAGLGPELVLPQLRAQTVQELLAQPGGAGCELCGTLQTLTGALTQCVRRRPGWLYAMFPSGITCPVPARPALVQGRFKRWVGFFIGGLYIVYLVIMFTCFGA